jgi:hypothetical protein
MGSLLFVTCSSPEFGSLSMGDDLDKNDDIVLSRPAQDRTHFPILVLVLGGEQASLMHCSDWRTEHGIVRS